MDNVQKLNNCTKEVPFLRHMKPHQKTLTSML
jgi:hypothetical protein